MKKRDIEAKRKLFHLLFGIILVILLLYGFLNKTHLFFLIIISIILSAIIKNHKIPILGWFLNEFEREKDIKKFPAKGLIFYLIGAYLVLSFFPMEIAMASILVLAFAEPTSYLFGIKYGKTKHPLHNKRFLEGWTAGIIAGFIGALVFLPWYEAIVASFMAMLAEIFEIRSGADVIDDNIVIPLVAAISIWIIRINL